jgi:hypothetical protein
MVVRVVSQDSVLPLNEKGGIQKRLPLEMLRSQRRKNRLENGTGIRFARAEAVADHLRGGQRSSKRDRKKERRENGKEVGSI